MKSIKIITEKELEELKEYTDIYDTDLLDFATACIELYKKRGNRWLITDKEAIERELTSEQEDAECVEFFKDYDPIEKEAMEKINDKIITLLKTDEELTNNY